MSDILDKLRDGVSRPVSMLERESYAKEIERLRAENGRLRGAIEFAHANGFEWPSDPLPPEPTPSALRRT